MMAFELFEQWPGFVLTISYVSYLLQAETSFHGYARVASSRGVKVISYMVVEASHIVSTLARRGIEMQTRC